MPVTHEEISALAYKFWKERGEPEGSPEVDWERAEATLQLKAINMVQTALSSDLRASASAQAASSRQRAEQKADHVDTPDLGSYSAPPQARSRSGKRKAAAPKSLS